MRFVPETAAVRATGLALTIAGCLFAIWARMTLGGNWSGRVSLMAGHELITSSPYALVRHPIYTGIVTGLAGTTLAGGKWRLLLGAVMILLACCPAGNAYRELFPCR
jgi:protein-S-isoprenylcysteine O-methyltransferase Ste14